MRPTVAGISMAGAIALAGCATGTADGITPGPGPALADSGPMGPDAGGESPDTGIAMPDGGQAPTSAPADHLLLTEVTLAPTGAEFIELANFTGETVSLEGYYLSDHAGYAFLPAGLATSSSADFTAGFPAGATLADGQIAVVAIDGSGFASAFGQPADFCLSGSGCAAMVAADVGSNPTLTNSGEPIILFRWDGAVDLVTDVDIVKAGVPSAANPMPNKAGLTVDGPDLDGATSLYLSEAMTMTGPSEAPGQDDSIKRVAFESGSELMGGNGMLGHDETSEDIATTWDDAPFSPATPGSVSASLTTP